MGGILESQIAFKQIKLTPKFDHDRDNDTYPHDLLQKDLLHLYLKKMEDM